MKWCRDPRCSPRGNPACRGTFAVASSVSSTVSHLRTEHGTSLETPGTSVFPWSEPGMSQTDEDCTQIAEVNFETLCSTPPFEQDSKLAEQQDKHLPVQQVSVSMNRQFYLL